MFNNSEALIFVDSDLIDAVMLSLRDEATFIKAADYGALSLNYTKYWARATSWRDVGGFVWDRYTLTTCGENSVDIPFKIYSDGVYDLWIRIGFATSRGKLSISIDGTQIGELKPLANFWSRLKWLKVTSLNLKRGDHTITLKNDGTGFNDIDAIAIVNSSLFRMKFVETINTLRTYPGRVIYILDAEKLFAFNETSGWKLMFKPYNGYVLHTDGVGYNISPKGKASASSFGTWDKSYPAPLAIDGNKNTRWASKPPEMPQWLQVEWKEQQELIGVHVLFERAYARDYEIQIWNGTNWVAQVKITGNTKLERYHYFPPIKTNKLRIYVTSAPKYELVSIWELEVYTTPWVSTKIYLPKSCDYIFAFRIATGPKYGSLSLKIDDQTYSIQCSNSNSLAYVWHEVGPISLKEGNHTLAIGGVGKIDIDQITVYSLNENEEYLTINDLFKESTNLPEIEYQKLNPCEYRVKVTNSSYPFLLIFSESYNPLWKAYLNDLELDPINAYSIVNAFRINKTGTFNLTIRFVGQQYADLGLKISGATFTITLILLALSSYTSKDRRFSLNNIKNLKSVKIKKQN